MSACRKTISHPQLRCCQNTSKISKLFCESPSQVAHFEVRAYKYDMLFVLDIMQVTYVTKHVVDLRTASFNASENEQY